MQLFCLPSLIACQGAKVTFLFEVRASTKRVTSVGFCHCAPTLQHTYMFVWAVVSWSVLLQPVTRSWSYCLHCLWAFGFLPFWCPEFANCDRLIICMCNWDDFIFAYICYTVGLLATQGLLLAAYQAWCAKPKNEPPCGWPAEKAKAHFLELEQEPNAIVEYTGPSEEFRTLIGIKVLHHTQSFA